MAEKKQDSTTPTKASNTIKAYGQDTGISQTKRVITPEMAGEICRILTDMSDIRYEPGVNVELMPDNVAWYIAYKT